MVLALTLGSLGCSSHVKRGCTLYAEGRYVEAAEVFEHTESQLGEASPRERAEYGTYRGLTLLVLGDLRNAHRWLAYAYQLEQLYPGSLRARQRALLDRGWYELGVRIGSATTRASCASHRHRCQPAAADPAATGAAARSGQALAGQSLNRSDGKGTVGHGVRARRVRGARGGRARAGAAHPSRSRGNLLRRTAQWTRIGYGLRRRLRALSTRSALPGGT